MKRIEIDKQSGCCFGVSRAIERAEQELQKGGTLYCLGDIVHNSIEVERLANMGLVTINHDQFRELRNVRVLLRAHGEPPSTYEIARQNNIELIDASCPVVLKLQERIKDKYLNNKADQQQIVIYGKKGHAEVNGLLGQTNDSAVVLEQLSDVDKLDFTKDITVFSQTTKSVEGLQQVGQAIRNRLPKEKQMELYDTICRQVSNRIPHIKEFAQQFDAIIFIAGEKSSNGRILFNECHSVNPNSFFIHSPEDVSPEMIAPFDSIGICGATSTPLWQMEAVEKQAQEIASRS